jgi:hypothetical protein
MRRDESTGSISQPSFTVDIPMSIGPADISDDPGGQRPRVCDAGSGLAVDTHRGERRSRARSRANDVLLTLPVRVRGRAHRRNGMRR